MEKLYLREIFLSRKKFGSLRLLLRGKKMERNWKWRLKRKRPVHLSLLQFDTKMFERPLNQ